MTRSAVKAQPLSAVVDVFGAVWTGPTVDADAHESATLIVTRAAILTRVVGGVGTLVDVIGATSP